MTQQKTIVITGASAGIGAELARRFARDHHNVVLAARRAPELEQLARELEALGAPRALPVVADVTERAQVVALAKTAIDAFGGFDVWINNAGRGIDRSVLDLTGDEFDDIMAVNAKSVLYGSQAAAEHFLERGRGHLINVSSFLGRVPLALHRSAYNAAKAAVNVLTANFRVELQKRNPAIHVTLLMPGMVSTDFAKHARNAPSTATSYAGPHVQTTAQVADIVATVIEHPVAEVYTNPSSADMARRYLEDVSAFETASGNPWQNRPPAGGAV
ncbi:MAG: SDR family NAD(P)-dependent oxidoreductase [Gemmatimonadaceae bacterium]